MTDAVVIGAGHNGLVAAHMLADAGWSVTVLEATGTAGGAVRTAELIEPGLRHDVFSAFYPLAAVSPAVTALDLAPGFRQRIRGRHVLSPSAMAATNPNLVGGAINGGTAQPHQQLVFRPGAGGGRAETPIERL